MPRDTLGRRLGLPCLARAGLRGLPAGPDCVAFGGGLRGFGFGLATGLAARAGFTAFLTGAVLTGAFLTGAFLGTGLATGFGFGFAPKSEKPAFFGAGFAAGFAAFFAAGFAAGLTARFTGVGRFATGLAAAIGVVVRRGTTGIRTSLPNGPAGTYASASASSAARPSKRRIRME